MNEGIISDISDMEKKLKSYVDKGTASDSVQVRDEPLAAVKPDQGLIKPLKRFQNHSGCFVAVDCSTRTLRRANNWGVYLMRSTYAVVRNREVDWGYRERICTTVGDSYGRSNFLKDFRIELESQMALDLLTNPNESVYYDHIDGRGNYMLLDGGGYFGGERKFRVSLYEKCEKMGTRLFAISKNSPSLHDEKGRDFLASVYDISPYGLWIYHPVRKADKDRSLYGDIAVVKLCSESSHVFRCDIMDYLMNDEVSDLVSPLTSISEDPRCVGYPIALWSAHEFSAPSDAALLHYYDQVGQALKRADLADTLRKEELSCSFADELHGMRYPFKMEMVADHI